MSASLRVKLNERRTKIDEAERKAGGAPPKVPEGQAIGATEGQLEMAREESRAAMAKCLRTAVEYQILSERVRSLQQTAAEQHSLGTTLLYAGLGQIALGALSVPYRYACLQILQDPLGSVAPPVTLATLKGIGETLLSRAAWKEAIEKLSEAIKTARRGGGEGRSSSAAGAGPLPPAKAGAHADVLMKDWAADFSVRNSAFWYLMTAVVLTVTGVALRRWAALPCEISQMESPMASVIESIEDRKRGTVKKAGRRRKGAPGSLPVALAGLIGAMCAPTSFFWLIGLEGMRGWLLG
ncbi:unnamed protein product [Vitrella brassicaformis CCMP3155]|uniref:Uncharacterized protein n=1 Tax=Vitrella brassicaformis (strain CCMP3155) TaxID=1169540 RepID=A0A0G4EGI6_VITBC|nr:unnamed protein product [Vitrella brassicaformis CCMP3155]|eukprot:CEL94568.1 unnamed protein product [Vitrella brassicaformis CCMP3155]